MIKQGVINGAKGILLYIPSQEKSWKKYDGLTNKILYSICGNLIEKAEAIRCLEASGLNNAANVVVRSFLELFVQFEYMLKDETILRAKSFYFNFKLETNKKYK